MNHLERSALAIGFTLLLYGSAVGEQWRQWRGPFLNGTSDETGLPAAWSKTEVLLWSEELPGTSGATPIIGNGRVFIVSSDKQDPAALLALCFNADKGDELWRHEFKTEPKRFPMGNNMASCSPVTDGERVWFLFGSGQLAAYDLAGRLHWQRDIQKEYGNLALQFGYSSSPFLYDGRLYILVLRRNHEYRPPASDGRLDSFLLALDPPTGKTLWKQPRPTDAYDETMETYSTPILVDGSTGKEIVIWGADYITGHDPVMGRELWRYGYRVRSRRDWRTIPSLATGAGLIFATEPKHDRLFALKIGGRGRLTKDSVAWWFDGPTPDCSTPLFYKNNLYILKDMQGTRILSCLEPETGKVKWQGELPGSAPWYASLTGADDKLYCISDAGKMVVLATDEFRLLFEIDLNERPTRSSIAIADDRLYIRTANHLYCVGEK